MAFMLVEEMNNKQVNKKISLVTVIRKEISRMVREDPFRRRLLS